MTGFARTGSKRAGSGSSGWRRNWPRSRRRKTRPVHAGVVDQDIEGRCIADSGADREGGATSRNGAPLGRYEALLEPVAETAPCVVSQTGPIAPNESSGADPEAIEISASASPCGRAFLLDPGNGQVRQELCGGKYVAEPADQNRVLRWLPGFRVLREYKPDWLTHDIVAGVVLATMLVPVGIAYAEASGLPGILRALRNDYPADGLCCVRPKPDFGPWS